MFSKNPCYLYLIFKKILVIFQISTLEFVKNEFLTHTVNFGVQSAFSEGPSPGLVPLYKVYHFKKPKCTSRYK